MKDSGFSLIETLVALLVAQLALLALVPMFVFASRATTSAGDMSSVSATAAQRMERLQETAFDALVAGGDLEVDMVGYSDGTDPDASIRWRITDDAAPPTVKTIEVRVVAIRSVLGLPRSVTLTNMKAAE